MNIRFSLLVFLLCLGLATGSNFAQEGMWHPKESDGKHRGFGMGDGHHGPGFAPLRLGAKSLSSLYFADRFLFQGRGERRLENRRAWERMGFLYGGGYLGVGPGWQDVPKKYSSEYFVKEWLNKDPLESNGAGGFSKSGLLSAGMSDEEVAKVLGVPLQRYRVGARDVWKYSAYTLYFEEGVLIEIR